MVSNQFNEIDKSHFGGKHAPIFAPIETLGKTKQTIALFLIILSQNMVTNPHLLCNSSIQPAKKG
jgi:hypothetical protein